VGNSDICKPPLHPPGHDDPDDNFGFSSFQSGDFPFYFDAFPFVGIFFNGYCDSTDALLTRLKRGCFKEEFDPIAVLDKAKVLIIPTGGVYGMENSHQLKSELENYVSFGQV